MKDRWRILPKNQAGVTNPDFHFSQKAFKAAADELGVEPSALQGGLWFAEKQHWANNGWGTLDLGDYRQQFEKIPLLKTGIKQRIGIEKAKKKGGQAEQTGLAFQSMKRPKLKDWVRENADKIESVEEYNTNNAWGFGGGIGKQYNLKNSNLFVRIGTAYFRHLPSQPSAYVGEKLGEGSDNYRRVPPDEFYGGSSPKNPDIEVEPRPKK